MGEMGNAQYILVESHEGETTWMTKELLGGQY
jgi:hypothetical protein